ncbi:unnamed protein product [Spirodela intermedia]|uniref:Uncharacterized protein n=1 Tax=Spirodela intermedia TaxID=51605 RepID=A0A7I8ILQ0_SPIIN|nr:unnamed protein product [Spirodela intermedia]CAA6658346.1 unnamed protein product [Spirodela intermedia]
MPEAPEDQFPPAAVAAAGDDIPSSHKTALQFIEDVTDNADQVQRRVLSEILEQNSDAEYLRRHGLVESRGADAFRRLIPVVTYEDLEQDIQRIAQGDTSPILCCRPISEFLTSSGTSGGERKLMPTIQDELDRRSLLYSLLMPGKGMYFLFVKSEARTPGGLVARPVLTSYYKSRHFIDRKHDPFNVYTSPNEAILSTDSFQSMYAQLLCGLAQRQEVLRAGAVFASGFIRAIRFLEKHWQALCRDIRNGSADASVVTDASVRAAVAGVLRRPDPELAAIVEGECGRGSWEGILTRLWPNTKYIDVIVTGTMAQYIPTLDYYSGSLPLACTMYASSECYFGLNLEPMCKPSEVSYTLIPTMAYFEFLPVHRSNGGAAADKPDLRELVELVDVELGKEYELVITTYAGGPPRFSFVCRKNVALSIDSDKTDEMELHRAVEEAVGQLEPFGASLVEYTSYADTSTIPGHYVLYWELQQGATPVPPSIFEDCCLAVEEALNSVYRQGRTADKSIGPLELRLVEEGTFDKLMDFAISRGASINQYKAPRCVKFPPIVELLNSRVRCIYFSPKCPKWVPATSSGSPPRTARIKPPAIAHVGSLPSSDL